MLTNYTISIENDVSKSDMEFFINSFRSYNTSIIGKQESHSVKIILKNNEHIIGGVLGTAVWGWLMVDYLWINEDFIYTSSHKLLLDQMENEAIKYGVKKISIDTIEAETRDYYEKNGYEVEGHLDHRPPSYTSYFLKKEKVESQSINLSNLQFSLLIDSDVTEQDVKELQQKIEDDQAKKLGELFTKDVTIFVRDDSSTIVGGVKGYIGWGWLYLSTLWVDDSYRGEGLGSKLLKKAEEIALENNIHFSFLGTTEFQAREFYEKNGYEVFAISEDLPPGYKNFSMKKNLIK